MDACGSGRKEDPSLPPGYVSLAQLRDRWMRMQEEKNLKEQKEDEKKGTSSGIPKESHSHTASTKKEGSRKLGGGLTRDPPPRIVENGGREMAKEKGKKIAVGGSEIRNASVRKMDKEGIRETETESVEAMALPRKGVGERIPNVKGTGHHGGPGKISKTLEKKQAEDEVLAAERLKNGFRRTHGNGSRGRNYQGPNVCDWEAAGTARSRVEGNGCRHNRRYGSSTRFGNEGRESGKVWVKKGEVAAAAKIVCSGISVDKQ